jgi:hypothetical protein
MICKTLDTDPKMKGLRWEASSMLSFKLAGWGFYVEWSPNGWHYFWDGDERPRLFYPTREAAMRAGVADLVGAIDHACEEEKPTIGPRTLEELKAELANVRAKIVVLKLLDKAAAGRKR